MRLLSLHLHTKFRGLPAGFHVDFRPGITPTYEQLEPICFVGLNGSGKSNVLQVLAEIFGYLETRSLLREQDGEWVKSDVFWKTTGFALEYMLDPLTWGLAQSQANSQVPADNRKVGIADYTHLGAAFPVVTILKRAGDHLRWDVLYDGKPLWGINRDTKKDAPSQRYPPLPRHVVGYSSGMNELISNPFIRLDVHYGEQLLQRADRPESFTGDDAGWQSQGYPDDEVPSDVYASVSKSNQDFIPDVAARNRMLYLDYESNKLITLANFLIPDAKRLQLLYDMARIENVQSFSLTINYPYHPDSEDEPRHPMPLPTLLNQTINRLIYCATTWTGDAPEAEFPVRLVLDFWVNEETKKAFNHHFRTADNLINELYDLRLLNVLGYSRELRERIKKASPDENLSVQLPRPEPQNAPFHIGDLKLLKSGSRQSILYRSLSDGEHQLLHVFGALMLMEQPGTLFLFDEPETHFNPEWRSRFVSLMNQIVEDPEPELGGIRKKREQEVLLTSHSPFIVSDCKPENVFVFKRETDGMVTYRRAADNDFTKAGALNTLGASERVILQEVFGYRKSISEYVSQQIQQVKQEATSLEKVWEGRQQLMNFGESFEKFDALNYLDIKEDEFGDK